MKAGWATLTELNTFVTRPQVMDMNDLLDAFDELEDDAEAEARRK